MSMGEVKRWLFYQLWSVSVQKIIFMLTKREKNLLLKYKWLCYCFFMCERHDTYEYVTLCNDDIKYGPTHPPSFNSSWIRQSSFVTINKNFQGKQYPHREVFENMLYLKKQNDMPHRNMIEREQENVKQNYTSP